MRLNEYRREAVGFGDLLLYDAMIAPGVLLLHDGSLLAAWRYRGPDMASRTQAEMNSLMARLNSILKLGSGWMIQVDAIRDDAPGYPEGGAFPDPVTRMIDEERRAQFLAEGAHYESDYYLTLTYQPPVEAEERVRGWLFEGASGRPGTAARVLDDFQSRIGSFDTVFRSLFHAEPLVASGGYDELLRYLRRAVTGADHPFYSPEIPACLQDVVAPVEFVAGMEPRVDGCWLRVLAVEGFPRFSTPGILHALDDLALPYRWHTRAILLDPEEARARIDLARRKWRSKVRKWTDVMLNRPSATVNVFAQEMADDAEAATGEAVSGDVQFAVYNSKIIFQARDLAVLEARINQVAKTLRNLGFSARLETINAVEAYLGSFPGDGYRDVRRSILHTLNVADLLPTTGVWAGLEENPSPLMPPHSPPLLYAATNGSTPYRLHLHVQGLGHTLVMGPPDTGKSTLLALFAAQWFRYPRAQVIAFDRGYSLLALTTAAGGDFYDVAGAGLSFCPLAELEDEADVAWAGDWIETLCALQSCPVSPRQRHAITEALRLLAASPSRTLTEFTANLQDENLRLALREYTIAGKLGHLLDADRDELEEGRFLTYELGGLMELGPNAVSAVLSYLFHRIEHRLTAGTGEPTLLLLDEAWLFLRNARFQEQIRDWLKTLRKLNAAVVLATQNLSDVADSPVGDVILSNCPTKILLPNAEARAAATRNQYQNLLGLNERELELVSGGLPRRDYYLISPDGRRRISLGLGKLALSFTGVSSIEERRALIACQQQYGDRWAADWLRLRGLDPWAGWLEQAWR